MPRFLSVFFSLSIIFIVATIATADQYTSIETEYNWDEIEDIGRPIAQLRDNSVHGPYPIGFRFPFYDQVYEEYWISANGFIGFGPPNEYGSPRYDELPNHFPPNNIIALYWKNLDPEAFWNDNRNLFRGSRNGNLIIQYQNFPELNDDGVSPDNTISMQIVLKPDGDIILQYAEVGDEFDLTVGSVGIENRDGTEGLTIRHNGEGNEIANETAYRITPNPPGNFLVWDGGTETESGTAQAAALESLGHTVTHLTLIDIEPLPNDLAEYEAVFVNLGNIGDGGDHYHELTNAEGARLANYLENGGSLYMEGASSWTGDRATDVHPFFMIEGVGDGASLEPPVTGIEGTFANGLIFEDYQADHNNSVDHLSPIENAQSLFTYSDQNGVFIGMVSYLGLNYRTVGCSFEFGGLVDGNNGTKRELMMRIIRFMRTPPPEFLAPVNIQAIPGDQEVTLMWDFPPHEGRDFQQALELQHEIARLQTTNEKPDDRIRERIIELRQSLSEMLQGLYAQPQRDELNGFNIYKDGELYDFTNAHRYTAIELENNQDYSFTVSTVYVDPDGESAQTQPIVVVPTQEILLPYTQDFELTRGPFTGSPVDGWEWGEPELGAASGTHAWETKLNEPYEDLAVYYLYSPIIDLRDQRVAWLNFNHYMESEGGWDGGRVELSLGDNRWTPITPRNGYSEETVFAFDDHPAFSGSTHGWEQVSFDLDNYLNQQIRLRFVFKSDDSNFRPYAGWFIDDVWLSGPDVGNIRITVFEEDEETIIRDVSVTLGNRYEMLTDRFGQVSFREIPEGIWDLNVSKIGYISDQQEVNIIGGQDINLQVALLMWDSELTINTDEFVIDLDAGNELTENFTLTNIGEHVTDFQMYIAYEPDPDGRQLLPHNFEENPQRDEPWDLVQTYNLSDDTDEQFFIGAQFVKYLHPKDYRLIVGAGDFASGDCFFYQFARDGSYLGRVTQSDGEINGWGLRDLAYDGESVIGAVDDRLFMMNPIGGDYDGEIDNIEYLDINRAVAYVPEDDAFWVGDGSSSWFKIHSSGQLLDQVDDHELTGVVGMAWSPADPNGANLYIHNQESDAGGAAIYTFNTETRELTRQLETAAEDEGNAGGLFVTHLYDTHNYHVGALIQQHDGNDVVKLYELWDYDGWLSVSPTSGEIEGNGAEVAVEVTFDATRLISSENYAEIEIHDLGTGNILTIPTNLSIEGGFASIGLNVVFDDDANLWDDVFFDLFDEFGERVDDANPDEVGHASFNDIVPGTYLLKLSRLEGYHQYSSGPIELESDDLLELDIIIEHIRLGGGEDFPALRGQVSTIYDEPLDNVEISAVRLGGNEDGDRRFFTTSTDDEGNYRFNTRLPEADYTISAHLDGWRSDIQEGVEIREGEEREANFVMSDLLAVQSLRTNGFYDDQIRLDWLPPGTVGDELELQYDDNNLANGVYLANREDILATRFEPAGEFDLLGVSIYILGSGDLGRPGWPDNYDDVFFVKIFLEDPETNLPGEMIISEEIPRPHGQHWVTVDLSRDNIRFLEEPFYVGWHQKLTGYHLEANGLDQSFDNEGTVFVRFDSNWDEYNGLPGDPMVRALIWSYFEDRPVQVNHIGNARSQHNIQSNNDPLAGEITLLNPNCPSVRIYENPFSEIERRANIPRRDPFIQYQLFIDGELVADDLADPTWTHIIGSENEDTEYSYMISALFEDGEEPIAIEGAQATGRANMPPRAVSNPSIDVNGLQYTLSWQSPAMNVDFSGCEDYAGCSIYVDGELVHFEAGDAIEEDYSWSSEFEVGEDGWHTFLFIAQDEVPNLSQPIEISSAIGEATIHNFELNDRPIFTAEPENEFGWELSTHLNGGPLDAHSGSYAWGTRTNDIAYVNDADWTLTSHLYSVNNELSQLDFYHYMSSEPENDGGQVLISVNNGDWQLIVPEGGYDYERIDGLVNTPGFTGNTNGWELVSFDLSDYLNEAVRFRWRFATDNTIYRYGGWYIDDIALWGCELAELAEVAGTVLDQNGAAVSEAIVSDGRVSTSTDENGAYSLTELYPGQVTFTVSKPGYRPEVVEIELAMGDSLEQNFDQYIPELSVEPLEFGLELRAGEQIEDLFEIQNDDDDGETIPWSIRIEQNDEMRRDDPWDIAFNYPISDNSGHSRYQGAEFVDGQFYLSVADPVNGSTIDRFDWEGEYLGSMQLPFDSVGWGLRDLTWDGEFLYGSQNDSIYAFTAGGIPSGVQAGAPIALNRALAYDRENDGFWAAEWDSPWYLLDRNGEVQFSWNGHNLTGVYGFAYHPEEPDGMSLYAFNREEDGSTGIYRADPNQGDIELVYEMAGLPAGCFITENWDQNNWMIGGIVDDHLYGFELGAGSGWITVSPASGELEPGESEDITMLITMPEDAEGAFDATINIYSYGIIQTEVSVTINVMDGFNHFPSPIVTEDFSTLTVESISWFGDQLPHGSEIALLTPRGEVGGAGRWFGREFQIRKYKGVGAFQGYEKPAFVIWNAENNDEFKPFVTFDITWIANGDDSTRTEIFKLDVIETNSQTIQLHEGWNLISSAVQPLSPFVELVLGSLDDNVFIFKNGRGRFWVPQLNFNNIAQWNSLEGYQLKIDEATDLSIMGRRIPVTTSIPLNEGWNILSYLPSHSMLPENALSGIWDEIQFIKDGYGQFVRPDWGYYGIPLMEPGQGYHIRMAEAVDLLYTANKGADVAVNRNPIYGLDTPPTGSDMSMLIAGLKNVDPIAGANLVVLAGENMRPIVSIVFPEFEGDHFPCGVIIRGDDTMTNEIEGAVDNELLLLVLRDSHGEYHPLNVDLQAGDLRYSSNGFVAVELEQPKILPQEFVMDEIYPNPFNSRTTVRFSVPEPTDVEIIVWSIQGRQVTSIPAQQYQIGWHNIEIDASVWSSGMYILELNTPNSRTVRKMVLMR